MKVSVIGSGGGGRTSSLFFDVNIADLELFGSTFHNTALQATKTSQLWSLHASGDEVLGDLLFPIELSNAPITITMERLYLDRSSTTSQQFHLDPRDVPEIIATAKDFKFNQINFGSLDLKAVKVPDGLALEQLVMKSDHSTIQAKGVWKEQNDTQLSEFNIDLQTKDLGKAISSWGYKDAIGKGEGDIKIDAKWPGKPSDFNFRTASGKLNINIKNASLLDFDIGAAKMAGLFLPRRLLLDFRDVFAQGMRFDSIKGAYQIESGDAFTSGLNLEGPVVDINMAGRIGLVKQDYDQVVTVNRRILGDSVPIAAMLANIANPILGAQLYIVKKLFEKQIDDILSVQYTIEGSWAQPKITPVVKNIQSQGSGEDELIE